MNTNNDNSYLCHVVRLQEEGLNLEEIHDWFERFDIDDVDVEGLTFEAEKLTSAERLALIKQSQRIILQAHTGITFGSIIGTFVIGWIFVGLATLVPLLEGFTGGAIGAGLKIGYSINDMVKTRKPVSVIVGGIIGWLLLVVTYLIFIGGTTLWDVVKAILLGLLSSWYLWRVKANVDKEVGCIVNIVMTLIYLGLLYLVEIS